MQQLQHQRLVTRWIYSSGHTLSSQAAASAPFIGLQHPPTAWLKRVATGVNPAGRSLICDIDVKCSCTSPTEISISGARKQKVIHSSQ